MSEDSTRIRFHIDPENLRYLEQKVKSEDKTLTAIMNELIRQERKNNE